MEYREDSKTETLFIKLQQFFYGCLSRQQKSQNEQAEMSNIICRICTFEQCAKTV